MIKEGFILRRMMSYNIVMGTDKLLKNRASMLLLNDTGSIVFEGLKAGKSIDEVAESLMAEYDVTYEDVTADIMKTIADLREAGVIE